MRRTRIAAGEGRLRPVTRAGFAYVLVAVLLAACGASSTPMPTSTPTSMPTSTLAPSPTLVPSASAASGVTPTPSAPSIDELTRVLLGRLRDPSLEATLTFEQLNMMPEQGLEYSCNGTLTVFASDFQAAIKTPSSGGVSEEIYVKGKVYLRSGTASAMGRWTRHDMLTDPVPTLASAFPATVSATDTGAVERNGRSLRALRLTGVDIARFLASLGLADPMVAVTKGQVTAFADAMGAPVEIDLAATLRSQPQMPLVDTTMTLRFGLAAARSPSVPAGFWVLEERSGYLIQHPGDWKYTVTQGWDSFKAPGGAILVVGALEVKGTIDAYMKDDVARLKKAGAKVLSTEKTTLHDEDARLYTFRFTSGGTPTWAVKVVSKHDGYLYVASMSGKLTAAKEMLSLFQEVLGTIVPFV